LAAVVKEYFTFGIIQSHPLSSRIIPTEVKGHGPAHCLNPLIRA